MSVTLHTSLGDIKIELYCELVPKTCENFLALCASNYYDNTKFHRNIKGFVIQGGDPTGTGKGGQSIWDKPFEDEFHSLLKHDRRGIVSMATRKPNQNKSQFFITYKAQSHLDNVNSVFGHVIYGFDTLDKMEKQPVNEKNRPLEDILLYNVTIHANPFANS